MSSGPNGHGVVSRPGICNPGGGSENEDCGLHCDFGFVIYDWEKSGGSWGVLKDYKRL